MSANLQSITYFKPRIEDSGAKTPSGKIYLVTAPHQIRDETWKNIDLLDGAKICQRNGRNNTQFEVIPLPGYSSDLVVDLTMACLCFANENIGNNIGDIDALLRMGKVDTTAYIHNINSTGVTHRRVNVIDFVQILVVKKTLALLQAHLDYVNEIDSRLEYIRGAESEALEALRRLKFTLPGTESIKTVEELYQAIRQSTFMAVNRNSRLVELQNMAKCIVDIYRSKFLDNRYSAEINIDFMSSLNRLSSISDDVDKLMASFDEFQFNETIKKVRELTPPVSDKFN